MKQLPKKQEWNGLFRKDKLNYKEMDYLRGGDGGGGGGQGSGGDPPTIP